MKDEIKRKIKKLKKERNYDEIYREFGKNVYKKSVPLTYRRKDFKKLVKEGKYEDIYNKYGEKKYYKLLGSAMFKDIQTTKGTGRAVLWKIKKEFKRLLKKVSITLGLAASSVVLMMPVFNEENVKDNEIKYEKEIENYDEKIKEYAKEVNGMNLDDVHIFMKVMDDMWGSIQGYKEPEKDIQGFLELDLATEDGYGVCRNMANDVARKLNAIDKKYNARTITVAIGETADNKSEINKRQKFTNEIQVKNLEEIQKQAKMNNNFETKER